MNYREEVTLTDPVVTYSSVNGNDNYKLFASSIAKKAAAPTPKPKDENKQ